MLHRRRLCAPARIILLTAGLAPTPAAAGAPSYLDRDFDGHGDPAAMTYAPTGRGPWVLVGDDCDDAAHLVHPGVAERCRSSADDDCDGDTNDPGAVGCREWYVDRDGDGFGGEVGGLCLCEAEGVHTASLGGDCDDRTPEVHPTAVDVCEDGVDSDCDGNDACSFAIADAATSFVGEADGDLATPTLAASRPAPGSLQLLVGAPGVGEYQGRVYVVDAAPLGETSLAAFPYIEGAAAMDLLGSEAVAPPVDLDGDGYVDVLIGAPGGDDGRYGSVGLVYLLPGPIRTNTSVSAAVLTIVGDAAYDSTTRSLDGHEDLDGDGVPDVVVVSGNSDIGGTNSGALYGVSTASRGVLNVRDAPIVIRGGAGDLLDDALVGDVDGDGDADLVVGAPDSSLGGAGSGAVYVYLGPIGASLGPADADAVWVGPGADARAGETVEAAGDMDGDGVADVLVGGAGSLPPFTVWLVRDPLGTDSLADAAWAAASPVSRGFGGVVLGDLDLDGDGSLDVVIGKTSVQEGDRGVAYVFRSPGTGRVTQADADLRLDGAWGGAEAATSLCAAGDVDGDGLDDLLVGGRSLERADADPGSVFLLGGGQLAW